MIVIVIPAILLICIIKIGFTSRKAEPAASATPVPSETATAEPTATAETEETPVADNPEEDPRFTDPNSILVCANKKHRLPSNYTPDDLIIPDVGERNGTWMLRQEAATALETMFSDAASQGISLVIGSGFRNEETQTNLWNYYVSIDGQEYADTISSRGGYSEHQTGLALDICNGEGTYDIDKGFADTAEGQWLYTNAYKYGFILRYPEGKEDITGYDFEPWHYRYVGVETSTAMYAVSPDETFEEYFHLAGGNYAD